jgi:ferredoxin-nitrate reductase
MHPAPFLEIHPKDAEKLKIEDGVWITVRSRRGQARLPAKVTKAIAPGTVFMPMHWGELWGEQTEVNALTHDAACPISLEPELKACAVMVSPVELTATTTAESDAITPAPERSPSRIGS